MQPSELEIIADTLNIDVHRNFGIRKKDVELLEFKDLRAAFYGIHNITIPAEMTVMLNPVEIIAIYVGTGNIKCSYAMQAYDLWDAMQMIDSQNHNSRGIRELKRKATNPHPITPSSRHSRMLNVSEQARQEFLDSFNAAYIGAVQQGFRNGFYDPNWDGRNRTIYINRVWQHIQREYEKFYSEAFSRRFDA